MKKKDLTQRALKTQLICKDDLDQDNFCIENPNKLSLSFYGSDTIQKNKQIIYDFQEQDEPQIPPIQELSTAKSSCSTSKQTPTQRLTKRKLPSFIEKRTLQKVCYNKLQDQTKLSKQINLHKNNKQKKQQITILRKYQSEKQFSKPNKKEQKSIIQKNVMSPRLAVNKKPLTTIKQVVPKKISTNATNLTNTNIINKTKVASNSKNATSVTNPILKQVKSNTKKPTLHV